MSTKVELNKNGRPVGWHGQSWVYYKNMMQIAFEEKGVLGFATGDETLAAGASDAEKKTFNESQAKVKQLIMASLSMELGQRVMVKKSGTDMWKYLEQLYEGKQNDATRTNQEIILHNKLQATKCKPNWDVAQHVDNMFMMRAQLAALNADMRDPIFINLLMKSLPPNPRFDRLRGMVETGASEVDTPEKLRDQIIRMDSYNKCDRELAQLNGSNQQQQQNPSPSQKPRHNQAPNQTVGHQQQSAERVVANAVKKQDQQQGNCYNCHRPGHLQKNCPKKTNSQPVTQGKRQATYTRRVDSDEVATAAAERQSEAVAGSGDDAAPNTSVIEDLSVKIDTDGGSDDYTSWEWCFDNAANVHVACDLRYFTEYTPFDLAEADCVRGFQKRFATTPLGRETVQVVVKKEASPVVLTLEDVFYVPDSKNLLSHSQAEDQGYDIEYHGRNGNKVYELWRDDERVLVVGRDKCGLYTFTAHNEFLPDEAHARSMTATAFAAAETPSANVTAADGAADLQRWHERLGHLCPQFVKMMADRGLVTGMMLQQRVFDDCEDCHMGKDRKPSPLSYLERAITRKNQVIFADLLFPHHSKGMHAEKAVLVIVDGYTRYTTIYPLKSKDAPVVNAAMVRYITWADRQFPGCPVQKVVTDNGKEFVNDEMELWYQGKGIEMLPNPPRSSHMNLCERAHQTLVHMLKTMLHMAGLPKTFWMYALEMATFIRNRSYHTATRDTPHHLMKGVKPDMHKIKKFGSIAYVHQPISPARKKLDDNSRIGFLVGYPEGQAGYYIYFPTEHTVQHVNNVSFNEDIVYKDRFQDDYSYEVTEWLSTVDHSSDAEEGDNSEASGIPSRNESDVNDGSPELPDYDDLEEKPAAPAQDNDDDDEMSDLEVGIDEWTSMPMYSAFPLSAGGAAAKDDSKLASEPRVQDEEAGERAAGMHAAPEDADSGEYEEKAAS